MLNSVNVADAGPAHPEAFFLAVPGRGQRYCLFHSAIGRPRSALLYVHPFAEEMNKSRRMAALQARALATAGHAVLQIDLLGCGDSSGDFGDASWQGWIDDLVAAAQWLGQRTDAPLWWWGLRAGCLLTVAAAAHVDAMPRFLFWQPPASGKLLLQQFLRLKLAADMLGGGADKLTVQGLREQLAGGASIDIAGYVLPPALALGLDQATLDVPARPGRVEWIEVSARPGPGLSPAGAAALARWQAAGWVARAHEVNGPAFWQSVEIELAPGLLPVTLAALQDSSGS